MLTDVATVERVRNVAARRDKLRHHRCMFSRSLAVMTVGRDGNARQRETLLCAGTRA